MKSVVLEETPKTYLLVFEKGEEIMKGFLTFVQQNKLTSGHFTAIGGVSSATLGFFDRKAKKYMHIPQADQAEVLSMLGDLELKDDDEVGVHAHIVLGLSNGFTRGAI